MNQNFPTLKNKVSTTARRCAFKNDDDAPQGQNICIVGHFLYIFYAKMIWVRTLSNPLLRGSVEKQIDVFWRKPHLTTTYKPPPTKKKKMCPFYLS